MPSFVLLLGAGIFAIVPGYAQDAASGERIFVQCKACHQIGEKISRRRSSGAVGETGPVAFRRPLDKSVLQPMAF
jgi:hypothetical protein